MLENRSINSKIPNPAVTLLSAVIVHQIVAKPKTYRLGLTNISIATIMSEIPMIGKKNLAYFIEIPIDVKS